MEKPFREVPKQDTRAPIAEQVTFTAEIHEFLTQHREGRGSLDHILNHVVAMYRDSLPPARRGPLAATAPGASGIHEIGDKKQAAPPREKQVQHG